MSVAADETQIVAQYHLSLNFLSRSNRRRRYCIKQT